MVKLDRRFADYIIDSMKRPIDDKTILFIENYSSGARGIVTRLFNQFLCDEVYSEYKFVWTCRDYDETMKIWGEKLNTARVWLVEFGERDFIKYLLTSAKIITSELLPDYYVKRKNQIIWAFIHEGNIYSDSYTKGQIQNFVRTLNNTDYFLCKNNDYTYRYLVYQNRISKEKICEIDYSKLYPKLMKKNEKGEVDGVKRVVIALSELKNVKSVSEFRKIRREIEGIARFYDAEVACRVPLSFFRDRFIQDEEATINTPNVYSDEYELAALLENCVLVITDSLYDAVIATTFGIQVVLYYPKTIPKQYVRSLGYYEKALNHDELLTKTDTLLRHDFSDVYLSKKILLIINQDNDSWFDSLVNDINRLSNYCNLTVLLAEPNDWVYHKLSMFSKKVKYIIHTKSYFGIMDELDEKYENEYETTEDMVRMEWIRIFGNEHFDVMITSENTDSFWENMFMVAPVGEIIRYNIDDCEFLNEFLI